MGRSTVTRKLSLRAGGKQTLTLTVTARTARGLHRVTVTVDGVRSSLKRG